MREKMEYLRYMYSSGLPDPNDYHIIKVSGSPKNTKKFWNELRDSITIGNSLFISGLFAVTKERSLLTIIIANDERMMFLLLKFLEKYKLNVSYASENYKKYWEEPCAVATFPKNLSGFQNDFEFTLNTKYNISDSPYYQKNPKVDDNGVLIPVKPINYLDPPPKPKHRRLFGLYH